MGINSVMLLKKWFFGDVLVVFQQLDLCGCMRYLLFAGFS